MLDLERSNSIMMIQLALGQPAIEDEGVSYLILAMRGLGNPKSEESFLFGKSKGSTFFPLTMIFSRFLQVQFCLDSHAFSW